MSDPVVYNWVTPQGVTIPLTLKQVRRERDRFDQVLTVLSHGGDKVEVKKRKKG